MTEKCPARTIEPNAEGFITEVNIPEACLGCIERALADSTVTKTVTDTYEQALLNAQDYIGDLELPAEEFHTWSAITLYAPVEVLARRALAENGFDLGIPYGESYVEGTESSVTEVAFECYEEKGAQE